MSMAIYILLRIEPIMMNQSHWKIINLNSPKFSRSWRTIVKLDRELLLILTAVFLPTHNIQDFRHRWK